MKKLLFAAMMSAFLIGCKDDDEKECVPPALSKHIVGDWKASVMLGTVGLGPYPVKFTTDGKIEGDLKTVLAQHFPGTEIDDLIKYTIVDEKTINVLATSAGNALPEIPISLVDSKCENVDLLIGTYNLKLSK